jgi:hypothetical protein
MQEGLMGWVLVLLGCGPCDEMGWDG